MVAGLGLFPALAAAADLAPGVNLFFIKRSLNANEVHYDAVVKSETCTWKKPYVESYWRDLEQGDHVYSEIGLWERRAYGFYVESVSDTEIEIKLRPLYLAGMERPVRARLANNGSTCRVSTFMTINGEEAEFQSVYIKVADSWYPDFVYFDLLGYRMGTKGWGIGGERVSERLEKDEGQDYPEQAQAAHWQSGVITRGLEMGRPR